MPFRSVSKGRPREATSWQHLGRPTELSPAPRGGAPNGLGVWGWEGRLAGGELRAQHEDECPRRRGLARADAEAGREAEQGKGRAGGMWFLGVRSLEVRAEQQGGEAGGRQGRVSRAGSHINNSNQASLLFHPHLGHRAERGHVQAREWVLGRTRSIDEN